MSNSMIQVDAFKLNMLKLYLTRVRSNLTSNMLNMGTVVNNSQEFWVGPGSDQFNSALMNELLCIEDALNQMDLLIGELNVYKAEVTRVEQHMASISINPV